MKVFLSFGVIDVLQIERCRLTFSSPVSIPLHSIPSRLLPVQFLHISLTVPVPSRLIPSRPISTSLRTQARAECSHPVLHGPLAGDHWLAATAKSRRLPLLTMPIGHEQPVYPSRLGNTEDRAHRRTSLATQRTAQLTGVQLVQIGQRFSPPTARSSFVDVHVNRHTRVLPSRTARAAYDGCRLCGTV